MNPKRICLGACLTVVLASSAFSAVIFDNADAPLTTTLRSSNNPPLGAGAFLMIGGSNVTINQIAINAQPLQTGQLKFVIFSDTSGGSTSGSLLLSDTVNVTASGSLSYILSDPISFTLQAGMYYDIGAIFSGTSINYTFDQTADTQNGISSIVGNANVDNFAAPVLIGHAAADINIRLFSTPSSAIPEPGTGILAAAGLVCAGLARRFRRRA